MLLGRYDGKLSAKFQIAFPRKFVKELGERVVITKGLEHCLIVVSETHWKTLLEGTEGLPFTQKSVRQTQRFLLGNAQYEELDSKGRCVIPEYLREYAHLTNDIVYAGIERFIEIWDKQQWENEQRALSTSIESITEKLTVQKEFGNE